MKNSSTYRVLYLLNLLNQKDFTKNELVEEFSKIGESVSKPAINSYIKKLLENDFNIQILNNKNENVYHLVPPKKYLNFEDSELRVLDDIKKVVTAQKDYDKIRKFIRVLYKFALNIKNKAQGHRFLNFGYYSKVNWALVKTLEEHCKNKDLIEIDYVLTTGQNKKISIKANKLQVSEWSERLYLWGIFKGASQLSYLPVDRIFMVNKVKKQNCTEEINVKKITYAISKELFEDIRLEKGEKLIKITNKFVFIERILNDEFYLVQRLMSFCPDLYYISDEKIKNTVKEKLNQLKSSYEREYE